MKLNLHCPQHELYLKIIHYPISCQILDYFQILGVYQRNLLLLSDYIQSKGLCASICNAPELVWALWTPKNSKCSQLASMSNNKSSLLCVCNLLLNTRKLPLSMHLTINFLEKEEVLPGKIMISNIWETPYLVCVMLFTISYIVCQKSSM